MVTNSLQLIKMALLATRASSMAFLLYLLVTESDLLLDTPTKAARVW